MLLSISTRKATGCGGLFNAAAAPRSNHESVNCFVVHKVWTKSDPPNPPTSREPLGLGGLAQNSAAVEFDLRSAAVIRDDTGQPVLAILGGSHDLSYFQFELMGLF